MSLCDVPDTEASRSIFYLNVHTWNLVRDNPDLCRALREADVVYCDGYGIRLGAWILGESLPTRMTAGDFLGDVCRRYVADGRSIYILAGEEGVAESAARQLEKGFPQLKIVGFHHGYLNTEEEAAKVIDEIRRLGPDLLIVGMGSPQQELWIIRNLDTLNVKVGWAVGALFDFVIGKVPRAPQWLAAYGFEWLYRLMMEPRRLWRRYMVGNVRFLAAVLAARVRGTIRRV
jgi:N-acetylglucosaminyldiphosphoundecaprenol N-acetyl-beta-D-mannosaminyltransferase